MRLLCVVALLLASAASRAYALDCLTALFASGQANQFLAGVALDQDGFTGGFLQGGNDIPLVTVFVPYDNSYAVNATLAQAQYAIIVTDVAGANGVFNSTNTYNGTVLHSYYIEAGFGTAPTGVPYAGEQSTQVVKIRTVGGAFSVQGSPTQAPFKILSADQYCDNGVIHWYNASTGNAILTPPGNAQTVLHNLNSYDFKPSGCETCFDGIVTLIDYVDFITGGATWSQINAIQGVAPLLPTTAAIQAFEVKGGPGVLGYILGDVSVVTSLLTYHFLACPGKLTLYTGVIYGQLRQAGPQYNFTTILGASINPANPPFPLEISLIDQNTYNSFTASSYAVQTSPEIVGGTYGNSPAVPILVDLPFSGGVIHGLNGFLLPTAVQLTLDKILSGVSSFSFNTSAFILYLQNAGLYTQLTDISKQNTLFVPSNAAFAAAFAANPMLTTNATLLKQVLQLHIVPGIVAGTVGNAGPCPVGTFATSNTGMSVVVGAVTGSGASARQSIALSSGLSTGKIIVPTASVAQNGMVYSIDTVLLLPSLAPTPTPTPTPSPSSVATVAATSAPSSSASPTTHFPGSSGGSTSTAAQSNPAGAIAGGVVGALIGLVLLGLLLLFLVRRGTLKAPGASSFGGKRSSKDVEMSSNEQTLSSGNPLTTQSDGRIVAAGAVYDNNMTQQMITQPIKPSENRSSTTSSVAIADSQQRSGSALSTSANRPQSQASLDVVAQKWSKEEVGTWLGSLGVSKATVKVFNKSNITGSVLDQFTSQEELVNLGVKVHGDRLIISRAVQELVDGRRRQSSMGQQDADNILLQRPDVQLDEVLASGNFGKVWRGTFRGALVAIKQPSKADDAAREDFLAEAKLMKNISNHPNVVQYFGACIQSNEILVVMEYCREGSLEAYLRANPDPSTDFLLHVAKEVAAGMMHLSEFIVHRDLATRNVLLSSAAPPYGVAAKVADFGLARAKNAGGYSRPIGRPGHDIPLPWTPNEVVLNGEPHTVASDVWMFAALMWEMFMGVPQGVDSEGRNLIRIPNPKRDRVPPLDQPPRCPNQIFALMTNCWAMDPRQRPSFAMIHSSLSAIK